LSDIQKFTFYFTKNIPYVTIIAKKIRTTTPISKWESCQSYPDFQRLVLLSDYFGLTLDELVRDIDVQEVREKNLNNEKLSSIYSDMNEAKSFIRVCLAIGVVVLIFFAMIVTYGIFFVK
jgi:transcriptional regulator with XRE-family HTH domain